jgi:hypothetical protein
MSGQTAKTVSNSSPEISAAGPDDPEEFLRLFAEMMRREQFGAIDAMVAADRVKKSRFPGGGWKLYSAYLTLSRPALPLTAKFSDAAWQTHLERLRRWIAARPDSITPRVALADAYVNYAWVARGGEFAHLVKDKSWEIFNRRLQIARDILEKASALTEKCPQWYGTMQSIALGQGWDLDEQTRLLKQAAQFEPFYYYFYQNHANALLPKWYGQSGDSEKFAERIASRIGGKQGAVIYFEVASSLHGCGCVEDESRFDLMSWKKIQEGYAAEEELFGVSNIKLNAFAGLAVTAEDRAVAKSLFLRIGDNWVESTWGSRSYFEESRAWALAAQPH